MSGIKSAFNNGSPWRARFAAYWLILLTVVNFVLLARVLGEGDRIRAGVDRGICSAIVTGIPRSTGPQPTTQYGRDSADNSRKAFADYGCNGTPEDYRR